MMRAISATLPALKPLSIAVSIHLCCRQHKLCKQACLLTVELWLDRYIGIEA